MTVFSGLLALVANEGCSTSAAQLLWDHQPVDGFCARSLRGRAVVLFGKNRGAGLVDHFYQFLSVSWFLHAVDPIQPVGKGPRLGFRQRKNFGSVSLRSTRQKQDMILLKKRMEGQRVILAPWLPPKHESTEAS